MGTVLTKNPEFARDLYDIIFNSLTEEEFERLWAYMLNEHKVHHFKYLRVMYENRKKKLCQFTSRTTSSHSFVQHLAVKV